MRTPYPATRRRIPVLGLLALTACQTPPHDSTAADGGSAIDSRQGDSPDKREFHLFRPTPNAWKREISTDRPDKTESPYTVDAGHYQVEADLVSFAFERWNEEREPARTHSTTVAATNLKAGLLDNVDLQTIVEPYSYERTRDLAEGSVDETQGFGDTTVRLKINLWGNDGRTPFGDIPILGTSGLGIMPFVKVPTNSNDIGNDSVEGGIILPVSIDLPHEFTLGFMTEFDIARDRDDDRHHAEFINSMTIARPIFGDLSMYVEGFTRVSDEEGAKHTEVTLDAGFTYGLTQDIQLDAGLNIGLTRAADDLNPFLGISWRFP